MDDFDIRNLKKAKPDFNDKFFDLDGTRSGQLTARIDNDDHNFAQI